MSISTDHYSNITSKASVSHHFLCVQCARLAIMAMAGRNRTPQSLRLATGLISKNFQEHLFGILRLRKYQNVTSKFLSHLKTRMLNMTWSNLRFQCLKVFRYHGNKSTILLFNPIFRTTHEVSTKLYFVEIN